MSRKWNAAINLKTRLKKNGKNNNGSRWSWFRVLPSPCIPYYIYPCGFSDQLGVYKLEKG